MTDPDVAAARAFIRGAIVQWRSETDGGLDESRLHEILERQWAHDRAAQRAAGAAAERERCAEMVETSGCDMNDLKGHTEHPDVRGYCSVALAAEIRAQPVAPPEGPR